MSDSANEKKTVKAEKAERKKPADKTVMYIGPTIHGVATQNVVYTEIPPQAAEAIKEVPEIGNLFVAIKDYPAAEQMIRLGRGYAHSAYKKALEYKNKNKGGF